MNERLGVCFCTSEAVPFAKTGGLADVAGALPTALAALGCDIRVVLPGYRTIDRERFGFRTIGGATVPVGAERAEVRFLEGRAPGAPTPLYLVAHDPSFDRPGLYGEHGADYPDNLRRFTVFGRGVQALVRHLAWNPDVVHCQDWQTALLPVWLRTEPRPSGLDAAATLLTVHNLAYQGLFPRDLLPVTGLPWDLFTPRGVEFYGKINLLKGGILFADLINVPSRQYAAEVQTAEFGCGLEGVLRDRRGALTGIQNGADYAVWDPAVDALLPARYTADEIAGKGACKTHLQRMQGLAADPAAPLLGLISRLVDQKGLDLVAAAADAIVAYGAQLVLLGTGDPAYHALFTALHERYPDRVAVTLGFDNALAHLIEAGADAFLMPSRYEPSGLNQLYSLRYGTVPIVRRTGGLADTVVDAAPEAAAAGTATGFVFDAYTPDAFLDAVKRALFAFRDQAVWRRLQRTGMRQDFSWRRTAGEYAAAYRRAISARRGEAVAP